MPNRRTFLQTTTLAALAASLPRPLFASLLQDALAAEEIHPGFWLITGGGGNVLLIGNQSSRDGRVILIDAKVAPQAWNLREMVEEHTRWPQTSGRPLTLINTHHHGDHTGGNFIFRDPRKDGNQSGHGWCDIIAHQNIAPRLEDTVNTRIKPGLERMAKNGDDRVIKMLPRITLDRFQATTEFSDSHVIKRPSFTLNLHHFGPGHTDNDIIVRITPDNGEPPSTQPEKPEIPGLPKVPEIPGMPKLPKLPKMPEVPELPGIPVVPSAPGIPGVKVNLLHMGDLLFHRNHPFIDRSAGADTRKWQHCLKQALKHCDDHTIVIPGHGDLTDQSGLTLQHDYFDALRAAVQSALQAGKSKEEITNLPSTILPEPFRTYGFKQIWPRTLGVVYAEEK